MTELVPITTEQKLAADEAFQAEQAIKADIQKMRRAWMNLAEKLWDFVDQQKWTHLGYENLSQWLAQPDIGLEWRQVYVYLQAYREWVVKRAFPKDELAQIPISRLREVTSAVQFGRVSAEEAFADASALGYRDLRDRYSGLAQIEKTLNASEESSFFVCTACGSRVKRREG